MSEKLSKKSDLHLARKIWHMIPGISFTLIVYFNILNTLFLSVLLGVAGLGVCFFEIIRLRNKKINFLALKTASLIMRKEEMREISGTPYYLISCFLVLLFFPKEIAILSILYLAIGDPVASIFGILYGSHGYKLKNGKSIIGTIAGVSFCMTITIFAGFFFGWSLTQIYTIALFGGLAGGLSEAFAIQDINDNLTIPLISALILQGLFIQLGMF